MPIEPRLKQLLDSWEDLREAGKTPTPEHHCRDCPELLEPFLRLLRRWEQIEALRDGTDKSPSQAAPAVVTALAQAVRFRVESAPRRGGMGEVFAARDGELGRQVALKFIQSGKGGAQAERRFRREVAITARLQHPGVVPVYGPALSDDGRSGYAMRFIEGESLDAAIARHHSEDVAQMKPTRAELLERFVAVCNTMAYAHSQGVILRDLKPGNIMLGTYSETFVVDWGVAKVIGSDDPEKGADVDLEAPADAEDSTLEGLTETGMAIGTYAYMPPEQARGDIDSLDERADVFALGAVLSKILTGQPAYTGSGLLQKAQEGELADCFARLDTSGADAELIALAKRCLAESPAERPPNAQGVLDALWAHEAGKEARARQERERRVAAEAKAAEERRRRRVTAALAVSVVAVLLVGGAGLWVWHQQRALREAEQSFRARQNRENAEASLARLDELYKRFLWTEAETLLERTETLVGPEGDADLRERIAEAKRNTAFIKRLDEIRLEKAVAVAGELNFAGALPRYRAAFEENGFDILNDDPAKFAAKLNASPVRTYLIAALDDWAFTPREAGRRKILAVTAAATGQLWRTRLEDAWDDGDRLAMLYDGIVNNERTPAIIEAVGIRLSRLGKDGFRRIEEGIRQYRSDFWLNFTLGGIGGTERAYARIGALRAALAIRPDTLAVFNNLGDTLSQIKEYDAAMVEYREAIRLDPKEARPHNNLGSVLVKMKEYDAAIREYNIAIELDPNDATPHDNLGLLFAGNKEYDAAIREYNIAIKLDQKNALPHYDLGNVFRDRKEYDAAIAEYNKAIELNPKLAPAHHNLGTVFHDKKEYDAAIREYNIAVELDPMSVAVRN